MIPESRLILSELIIRELTLPDDVLLARKSLIRWIALSLGLISPNESRRLLLDIMEVLFEFHVRGEAPTTRDVFERLEALNGGKPNPKAVYYHLLKLKELGLIIRKKGRYTFGSEEGKNLRTIFRDFYMKKSERAFGNIEKALEKLENGYK